jgi:hypothetical protein
MLEILQRPFTAGFTSTLGDTSKSPSIFLLRCILKFVYKGSLSYAWNIDEQLRRKKKGKGKKTRLLSGEFNGIRGCPPRIPEIPDHDTKHSFSQRCT